MLDTKSAQDLSSCSNCNKNCNLVKKYEELINLYRKKQAKLSFSTSRISNIPTSSNTLQLQTIEVHCKKIVDVLAFLFKKRCSPLFRFYSSKSAKKFLLLNLCNRISKSAKINAFKKLKHFIKQQDKHSLTLEQQNHYSQNNTLNKKVYNLGFPVIQQQFSTQITSRQLNSLQSYAKNAKWLSEIKSNIKDDDKGYKNLQRRNMQLEVKNKFLKAQNQHLKEALQEMNKRMTRQNQKKEENITAFAQQMNEKNQQIQQLKQTLREYEQAHPPTGNILQNDVFTLAKDLDQLNNLNKRLNQDLDKVKDQLLQSNKNLRLYQETKIKLQKQNFQLSKSAFQMNLKVQKYQKNASQYSRLIKVIEKKIKRLNTYQKQIDQRVGYKKAETTNCIQQLKSQIILMYLTNISDSQYKLHSQNLFDSQQKNFLINHKQTWMQNHHKNKKEAKKNLINYNEMNQISQIFPRDAQQISEFENIETIAEPQDRKKQGTTMRIIQLELEIKKYVQKITQLKDQFYHVRAVILNLLKSLQLQQPSPATKDILRVIFDIFQYSQKERENIYVKKKRIFGFI